MTKRKLAYIALVALMILAMALTGCQGKKKPTTTTQQDVIPNYTYIKFANIKPTQNSDMLPDGVVGSWMGYYYGSASTQPVNYQLYSWVKIQGNDGLNGQDGKDGIGTPGADGVNGLSAYEIAVAEGATTLSQTEWIESLKGKDGENGHDGKSAYEIALVNELIPATMTETEWIESLKGKDGANGQDGNTNNGCKAEVLQITNTIPYTGTIDCRVNADGDAVYLLKLYCVMPPAINTVNVQWLNSSPVNSIATDRKWFVEYGDLDTPNSQVVICIPIAPYFKNYFVSGDLPTIRITGLTVSLACIEQAMF